MVREEEREKRRKSDAEGERRKERERKIASDGYLGNTMLITGLTCCPAFLAGPRYRTY